MLRDYNQMFRAVRGRLETEYRTSYYLVLDFAFKFVAYVLPLRALLRDYNQMFRAVRGRLETEYRTSYYLVLDFAFKFVAYVLPLSL